MKRVNGIYENIYSIKNLQLADKNARRHKANQRGIVLHDRNREANIIELHHMLKNKRYKTSPYTTFKIREPKEREIFRLPYWPDRITHHAIMNYLEPLFVNCFISQSYSCIKGRGILGASLAVRKALKDVDNTQFCLQLDIKKFYPSINHVILKKLLRKKIKDKDLLWLLDEIIDSSPGLPIGNYLSQYLANFYLTYFDHWIKETKGVKNYFRYTDDMIFLAATKQELHQLLADIREFLQAELKLDLKYNYQIYLVKARGINFVGYVKFHTHVLLRPEIKRRYARMLKKRRNPASIASYMGWMKHADCINLKRKLAA